MLWSVATGRVLLLHYTCWQFQHTNSKSKTLLLHLVQRHKISAWSLSVSQKESMGVFLMSCLPNCSKSKELRIGYQKRRCHLYFAFLHSSLCGYGDHWSWEPAWEHAVPKRWTLWSPCEDSTLLQVANFECGHQSTLVWKDEEVAGQEIRLVHQTPVQSFCRRICIQCTSKQRRKKKGSICCAEVSKRDSRKFWWKDRKAAALQDAFLHLMYFVIYPFSHFHLAHCFCLCKRKKKNKPNQCSSERKDNSLKGQEMMCAGVMQE